ncbi:MAG: choice-of-anchor V domain-containing protein, partial [Bacteroidota bacterium]
MKKKSAGWALLIGLGIYVISMGNYLNTPNGYSGAPGDGTCATCHSTNSAATGEIQISGLPPAVLPGQTYPLSLEVSANVNFLTTGFQLTVLDNNLQNAGDLSETFPDMTTSTQPGSGWEYLKHEYGASVGFNSHFWNFTWQAPSTLPPGTAIRFYASTAMCNGDQGATNDVVATKTQTTFFQSIPLALNVSIEETQPITCSGQNNAVLSISQFGGLAPYTYQWSNGANTPSISNVSPGFYEVEVTDANNFTANASFTVQNPPAFEAFVLQVMGPDCGSANTGFAQLQVTGGIAPYSYTWSNGATTNPVSNLPVGISQVLVTDANGCSKLLNVTVPGAPELQAQLLSTVDVECSGDQNGFAELLVTGGTPPYTYIWSNGSTGNPVFDLPSGSSSVTVTDANQCTLIGNQAITIEVNDTEPPMVSDAIYQLTLGANDPVNIDLYQYLPLNDLIVDNCGVASVVLNPSSLDCDDLGLTIEVQVVATDSSGNSTVPTETLTINYEHIEWSYFTQCPPDVELGCGEMLDYSVDVTSGCDGGSLELITGYPSGSMPPAGVHPIEWLVTYPNGMQESCSFLVTVADGPSIEILDITPSCFEANDGSFTIAASQPGNYILTINGEPIQYSGADTTVSGVEEHFFTIILEDATIAACPAAEVEVEIPELPAIEIDTDGIIQPTVNENGSIEVTVSGGQGPYTYEWIQDGMVIATTEDLLDVPAGTYQLRIIDDAGCRQSSEVYVLELVMNTVNQTIEPWLVYPNPANEYLYLEAPVLDFTETQIRLFDRTGRFFDPPLAIVGSGFRISLETLPSGLYFV